MTPPGPRPRVAYAKPPLSYEQQVALLISNGMSVVDPMAAAETLKRVNYYRLSGYWHAFKQPDGRIAPGTALTEVLRLYEFDRELRGLLVDALERFEVQLRTAVAYTLALRWGPFAHETTAAFRPWPGHAEWLARLREETSRSRETFVLHHHARYLEFPALPVWVAAEVMTLSSVSRLYEAMQRPDRRAVAAEFGIHHDVLRSWVHTLAYVRNICARHLRLWNRGLAIKPDLPWRDPHWNAPWVLGNHRIYTVLLMLRHVTQGHHAADDWAGSAVELLQRMDAHPQCLLPMGMPADWREHPLWRV